MKGKSRFQLGTGVTSILMIFVILCLTTFAILAYSSASADLNMTKKHVSYMDAYYAAYSKLNDEVARIDKVVYRLINVDTIENLHNNKVMLKLRMEDEQRDNREDVVIDYQIVDELIKAVIKTNINDKQVMIIEITININDMRNRCIMDKCYIYTEGEVIFEEETLPDMWGG